MVTSPALRAAAEGAVLAYAEVTGETWKAYEAPAPASASISRRGAAVEMAAFQTAQSIPQAGPRGSACFRVLSYHLLLWEERTARRLAI